MSKVTKKGRPLKYGEPTEKIVFRCPISIRFKLLKYIESELKKCEV